MARMMTIVVASRAGANVEASDGWPPDILVVDFGALPALASNSGPYGFVKILRALCPTESGEIAMRGVIDDLQREEISVYRAIHLDGTHVVAGEHRSQRAGQRLALRHAFSSDLSQLKVAAWPTPPIPRAHDVYSGCFHSPLSRVVLLVSQLLRSLSSFRGSMADLSLSRLPTPLSPEEPCQVV